MIKGQVCRALPYQSQSSHIGTVASMTTKDIGSDPSKQIFVKNLPKTWTHSDLNKNFESFGEINSAKVSITANFESRGYGFVEFEASSSVEKAVAAMHDK